MSVDHLAVVSVTSFPKKLSASLSNFRLGEIFQHRRTERGNDDDSDDDDDGGVFKILMKPVRPSVRRRLFVSTG
jgi:hypothetical protein